MIVGGGKVAEIPAVVAGHAVRDRASGNPAGQWPRAGSSAVSRIGAASPRVPAPQTVIGGEAFRRVFAPGSPIRRERGRLEGRAGFGRLMPFGPDQRVAEAGLKCSRLLLRAALGGVPRVRRAASASSIALPRCEAASLQGGAAQGLVAGLAPPFDRRLVEPAPGSDDGRRVPARPPQSPGTRRARHRQCGGAGPGAGS